MTTYKNAPKQPKHDVELQGSIREFNVSDIVQFLSGSEKTGKLHLTAQQTGAEGSIVFANGTVVHAELAGAVGEEAFFDLMLWGDGQFAFEPDAVSREKTVRQSSTNLLLEGARRKDEWSVLSQYIPDMGLVPEFVLPDDNETGQQITLNTSEWVVLSKIDGERNLKEVAEAASISEYHTCRLIYPLVANKLIRLRARRSH
jgi:hypothetical protein